MSVRFRIRSLKPEIWADEKVGRVSLQARLLFVGLITMADDAGRIRELPTAIQGHVFPYDRVSPRRVVKLLQELENVGLLQRYQVLGVRLIALPGWSRHQKVQHPSSSVLPPPPPADVSPDQGVFVTAGGDPVSHESLMRASEPSARAGADRIGSRSRSEGKGEEGKRQDVKDETAPSGARAGASPDLADTVQEVVSILRGCPRLVVDDITTPVGVQNAIAARPDVDPIQAAHVAVAWASDPAWRKTNPAAVFLDALRDQARDTRRGAGRRAGAEQVHPADEAVARWGERAEQWAREDGAA